MSVGPIWAAQYYENGETECICEDTSVCPACGDPFDYCQGHGLIGDPDGAIVLAQHDQGIHTGCVLGCGGRE
jgi:hypothetical protein